jgi:uncharacterized protein YkwD
MSRLLICLALLPLLWVGMDPLPAADPDRAARDKVELTRDEQTLVDLINKERMKEKLPPLQPNPILCKAARAHSANMAKQGKMEHILDGKTPGQRVLAAGYDYGKVAENIAMSDVPNPPLPAIVKDWMESKSHRANILGDKVTETGLGIATNDKGEAYFTQVFARPRKVLPRPKEP